jgi:hypothetical protein
MLDGKTGKPRTIIDIEQAALLSAEEGDLTAPASVASEAWRESLQGESDNGDRG